MSDPAADPLRLLHDEVDRRAGDVAARHGTRLQCRRGCSDCCVDGLTVFAVEAERIRRCYPELLREGAPHPAGACAFLAADGACRVYDARPYVCRTQGLPLRWREEDAEYRDICPLNETGGPPLLRLAPEDCWTLGPFETRLAELELRRSGDAATRVALRELFESC